MAIFELSEFKVMLQFSSLTEFLQMGHHGLYIWSAYGLSLLVVAANVLQPIFKKRQLIKQLRQSYSREK